MTAYAVAILRDVEMGAEIVEYLERIDATLAPFGGEFAVHGAVPVPLEGTWDGTLIVIAFPDAERARGWYDSAAYQEILPLRTRNSRGTAILVDGVGAGHRATDVLRPAS
ncbi:DUF1330 domain-containing protein [Pseudonocardia humida]|uniref:DUF1330 domain-containing protein n=1 Tax=Pseudonocardia humida TaxID=2800819 RepID=A0ABT1AAI3_9PSEU|nr:DUF1330 domain-containing protein [Pseudonocardia humida]MCO1659819.1 DUF1330 domain-containing protein [Pseudonocardia humida]